MEITEKQAVERLKKYKDTARFTAEKMGVPEGMAYDIELHNACVTALEKRIAIKPKKTTIFEGAKAEELAAKGLKNYETYKCPICNWIVADRSFIQGMRVYNYCQNCGQALDTEITKEQNT